MTNSRILAVPITVAALSAITFQWFLVAACEALLKIVRLLFMDQSQRAVLGISTPAPAAALVECYMFIFDPFCCKDFCEHWRALGQTAKE